MSRSSAGTHIRRGSACTRTVALLLAAAFALGALPLSVEVPLPATGEESACRFEPIDVCDADDTSWGMFADTPVLLADALVVLPEPSALPAQPDTPAVRLEVFAPGVYRPPRPSC